MPLVPVQDYEADWLPSTNENRIRVWISSSPNPWSPQINSEAEFVAILTMLGRSGVQVDTQKAFFHIPRRPVGS